MNQRILRQCGDDGLRIWTLAREAGKPNLIDEIFLEEMEDALRSIDKDREAKGLLIRSSHTSVFLAGADLSQLSRKSSRDLDRLLSRGQDAFAHLARLSIPTACAIDGACLGGGYEMALACRLSSGLRFVKGSDRVARDKSGPIAGMGWLLQVATIGRASQGIDHRGLGKTFSTGKSPKTGHGGRGRSQRIDRACSEGMVAQRQALLG